MKNEMTSADLESRIKEAHTTISKTFGKNGNGAESGRVVTTATTLVGAVLRQMPELDLVSAPDHIALAENIAQSFASGGKLKIFAPSCPDYKHDGSTYTFGELGNGVSLLGLYQIEFAEKLLQLLDVHGVPYDYIVLTADIEVEDDAMLAKNRVTKMEAIEKVKGTIKETGEYASGLLMPQNGSTVRSVGFLQEFNGFPESQRRYEVLIGQLQTSSAAFRKGLEHLHEGRLGLYSRLFPGANQAELHNLMPRTIRTMAQYATLGQLAREQNAVITSHRTLNIPAYNNPKLFLGRPEDYRRVPVFNFDRGIY
ncbi:hypothetical protein HYU16_04925 [Candidatus Woesearchaeota archaeon]|nr:hypothetical protein [Candidatus Woesearchaeota archaeon]